MSTISTTQPRESNSPTSSSESLPFMVFGASDVHADARYASGFVAMDAYLTFGFLDRSYAMLSRMEATRARSEGRFHEALELPEWQERAHQELGRSDFAAAVSCAAKARGLHRFQVPHDFPARVYRDLLKLGVDLEFTEGPLFKQRIIKRADELAHLREGARAAVAGILAAREMIGSAEIRENQVLYLGGAPLTSERVRLAVRLATMEAGAGLCDPIAAGGVQGADPHCIGYGPLRAGELIVVDVFPRNADTGYWGDLTRTYLRGRPSPEQARMAAAVQEAHARACESFGPNVTGAAIDRVVRDTFTRHGFETRRRPDGNWEGCFCGIGHGLGLEVHEAPFMGEKCGPLLPGTVLTIEPGLYYPAVGGFRVEDTIVITETGYEMLPTLDYEWILPR